MKKFDKKSVLILILIIIISALSVYLFVKEDKEKLKDKLVALVNGEKIYNSDVNELLKTRFGLKEEIDFTKIKEGKRKDVLEQVYVNKEILKNANKDEIIKSAAVEYSIKEAVNNIKREAFLKKIADNGLKNVNLDETAKEYINSFKGKKEVKARHILVKTKKEASWVRSKLLKNKAKFSSLAKKYSLDETTGENGGNLGFFKNGDMVTEFENVAFVIKKNTPSLPFQSKFGWHILEVTERRNIKEPTLEEAKEKIKNDLYGKAILEYVNSLKKDLTIEYR